MGIRVRIISGYNAGGEVEIPTGQTVVAIGRSPDADVRLHEDDRGCGRGIHARLLLEGAYWFVEADHDNGVTLEREGKTIDVGRAARAPVGRNARLTLGKNGPQLRLSVTGAAPLEMAPTYRNDEQQSDMPVGEITRGVAESAAAAKPGLRRLGRIVAVVTVIAIGIGSVALFRGERARKSASRMEASLRQQLGAHAADTGARLTALKGTIEAVDGRMKEDLAAVLRSLQESVVMLALVDSRGGVRFVGTGWSVGDRQLATNAHVAEALREGADKEGLSMIARRATTAGLVDTRIIEINAHPGYAQWSQILADPSVKLRAGVSGSAGASVLITPCDVAICRTEDECGPPLSLASDDELKQINAGDEVGYIGFPAENVYDPRSSPPALLVGRIVRLTDFFYNPADADPSMLVHHDLPTVGGASGSPIVNASGKVIAINSAGTFVAVPGAASSDRPARAPVGFNYGQSVAFLRECLDQSADRVLPERNARWQQKLRQFTLPPEDLLATLATQAVAGMRQQATVSANAAFVEHLRQRAEIRSQLAGAAVVKVDLPADTTVLVQACADDRSDIDLQVANDEQFTKILAEDTSANAYPQAGFVTRRGGAFWVRVYADRTTLERPVVTLRVSRLAN